MIPPTPTPLPPPSSLPMTLPGSVDLWYSTDSAIQYWRLLGGIGTAMQMLAAALIVVVACTILLKWMRQMSGRDAES